MRTLQQVFRRRSSIGSSINSGGNSAPHLLASPSSDSIGLLSSSTGLPLPAPPAGATPPRASSRSRCSRTPPRPSPDNTVVTRKSYGTCTSQSDTTQVVTNVASSKAHHGSSAERSDGTSDFNGAMKAAAAAAAAALDGTEDVTTLSDDDESDTISDLTALSAAYNSGAHTEEGSGDQSCSAKKSKGSTPRKPKSIFRRKLKYTKPHFSFGRNSIGKTDKPKDDSPPSPPRAFNKADISVLLDPSMEPNDQQQQVASPKTPKTEITEEASLDYSTDEDDSPVSRRNKSNSTDEMATKKTNDGGEWNRVGVHTPPPPPQANNIVHSLSSSHQPRPKESMSTPSVPTKRSSDSSTSLTSYSGDTFSTLTTKSSTNPSTKSAPAKACIDNVTKSEKPAICHRRAKSQEMDDLFATILSITDAPEKGIEDMLKTNKTVQSQTKNSRRKRQVSNVNAIANLSFVEHEERARARESGGVLVPRFESYATAEEKPGTEPITSLQPPQLPMTPRSRHHRRLPSREERLLAAPRMPLFPRNDQQGPRNKSVDSIERGRQSPHVQFREERLCSFYSNGGGNIKRNGNREGEVFEDEGNRPADEQGVFGYEHEEELLESEIYQTLLSMEAFDVKVEELNDLSDDLDDDEVEGSLLSSM